MILKILQPIEDVLDPGYGYEYEDDQEEEIDSEEEIEETTEEEDDDDLDVASDTEDW